MRSRFIVCLVILSVIGMAGCGQRDSKAAVQEAVKKHLERNAHLMLNSFTTQFETVTVKGDTADALVKYQSKNVPKLAVHVRYGLKKINGTWQVVSSSSAGGQMTNPANPHEGVGTLDSGAGAQPPPKSAPGPIASH